MEEKLELVKFNLTPVMVKELIKFSKLKKELIVLKNKKTLKDDDLITIQELEKKLNISKNIFIREFRKNNKSEIVKYLNLKDQI